MPPRTIILQTFLTTAASRLGQAMYTLPQANSLLNLARSDAFSEGSDGLLEGLLT
jgi:hypothetical protein